MKQHPFRAPIIFSLALLLLVGALLPLSASASPNLEINDASGIVSDDFNRCTPAISPWQVVDPLGKMTLSTSGVGTNDAVMEMSIPGGETLNVNDKEANAPRVMQPAADTDFEIEVKFDSGVDMRYQIQGILVAGDDNDFMRFDFNSNGSDTRLFAAFYSPTGVITETKFIKSDPIRPDETANGVSPLWLRVKRVGDTWTPTYSEDGTNFRGPTDSSGSFNWPFDVTSVGVFVGTTGTFPTQPAHTAKVDYFFNNTARLDPEDGPALKTNVNPEGAGTVATTPPTLGDAQCDQPITLQASPNSGFGFANWSGDATGAENPKTITFTGGQEVTANFSTAQYTLNASVAGGNGSVSPESGQYAAGTPVDVTATADPGWLFAGWSGDVAVGQENQNPLTVTMDSNKTLLATFVEDQPDQYTLNAMVTAGSGGVTKSPNQAQYNAGTSVDVTATADPGWLFAGWSGDVPAGQENQNPVTITMDSNKTISATFVEGQPDQYSIDMTELGQGTVVKDPTGPNYNSGTQVKLTATADPGWTFAGWSGDVPAGQENQNPLTVTMDNNKSITATFARSNTIYMPIITTP